MLMHRPYYRHIKSLEINGRIKIARERNNTQKINALDEKNKSWKSKFLSARYEMLYEYFVCKSKNKFVT